jgi:hypothetical protein
MPDQRRSRRSPLAAAGLGLAAIVVILALAAALDLGPFSDENGQLSRSEFISQGDEICRQDHDKFTELQSVKPANSTEAANLQEKLIAISETELDQIEGLDAPSDAQPALDRYLRAREQGITLLKKGLAAAERDDAFAYLQTRQQLAATQHRRTELAQQVGFRECSSSFGGESSAGT